MTVPGSVTMAVAAAGPTPAFIWLGQPEVENLDLSVAQQKHVLGFQVAMDDPLLVGGGEAACNLDGRIGRTRNRHRPGRGRLPQRLASEELHDEVVPPLVHARVVDLENVRVGQRGNRFGFPLESRAPVGISRERLGQDFDRDAAIEARIEGAVDLPHAALTDHGLDGVQDQAGPPQEASSTAGHVGAAVGNHARMVPDNSSAGGTSTRLYIRTAPPSGAPGHDVVVQNQLDAWPSYRAARRRPHVGTPGLGCPHIP